MTIDHEIIFGHSPHLPLQEGQLSDTGEKYVYLLRVYILGSLNLSIYTVIRLTAPHDLDSVDWARKPRNKSKYMPAVYTSRSHVWTAKSEITSEVFACCSRYKILFFWLGLYFLCCKDMYIIWSATWKNKPLDTHLEKTDQPVCIYLDFVKKIWMCDSSSVSKRQIRLCSCAD